MDPRALTSQNAFLIASADLPDLAAGGFGYNRPSRQPLMGLIVREDMIDVKLMCK